MLGCCDDIGVLHAPRMTPSSPGSHQVAARSCPACWHRVSGCRALEWLSRPPQLEVRRRARLCSIAVTSYDKREYEAGPQAPESRCTAAQGETALPRSRSSMRTLSRASRVSPVYGGGRRVRSGYPSDNTSRASQSGPCNRTSEHSQLAKQALDANVSRPPRRRSELEEWHGAQKGTRTHTCMHSPYPCVA